MPHSPSSRLTSKSRIRDLEKRFLSVNRDRLRRVHDNLTPRQQDFLDLLPVLFHINHPLLPGYVSRDTPAGICKYVPSRQSTVAAKRVSKSFAHDKWTTRKAPIRGIYLMGSPGTIAYSKASDLDIWLCHVSELEPESRQKLQRKAVHIEQFAATLGLEMHFFVFDPERFRTGQTIDLSAESSGSSQHFLLLDEFYRSGLVVAGLSPLWWRVPPDQELNYENWAADVKEKRIIKEEHYVDFGGLTHIPAEEFFGAAVWQLYKSITSPYKSVLKLLLMEAYAKEYPYTGLLSHRYKSLIAGDKVDLDALDPYVLMYSKVEDYLKGNSDPTRLNLLRRSFYLKANERLSVRAPAGPPGWRRGILQRLVESWGWEPADILHLDQRDGWKIETAQNEWRDLMKVLQQCYATLSDFARCYATDTKISQSDLNILGHKLYAAFEKKPSKIEIVTRGICKDPVELELSLHETTSANERSVWVLYKGTVPPERAAAAAPMKRARSIVEILAWCHFNKIVSGSSNFHIYTATSLLSTAEVRKTLTAMSKCFPEHPASDADSSAFAERPQLKHILALVNAGINPLGDRIRDGVVLTSNRTDAFQFGGQRLNLVKSIDLVIMTNWGEVFTFPYDGPRGLMDAVLEYLQWSSHTPAAQLPQVPVGSFSNDYAKPISQRVGALFHAAMHFLCDRSKHDSANYVVQIEDCFYRLYADAESAHFEEHAGYGSLVKSLGRPFPGFTQVKFDKNCRSAGVLPAIYALNRPSTIQVFGQARGDKADVYVLDACGACFAQRRDLDGLANLFEQYQRFLVTASRQFAYSQSGGSPESEAPDIEFYEILPTSDGKYCAHPYVLETRQRTDYSSIRVFADEDSDGHPQFTVFCDDREFSTMEYGGRLFVAIARFVLSRRHSPELYPVYITDLDLSTRFRTKHGIETHQIIHLLNYKKRIEYQLTKALRVEAGQPGLAAEAS